MNNIINFPLEIDQDLILKVTLINTGNPHCVIYVDDVDAYPVENIAKKI